MFTLAHFSDIHFAPMPSPRLWDLMNKRMAGYINWQKRRGHHRREVLDALVADLKAQPVDHIAVTGDLTNIGLPEEFRRVGAWLADVGAPETVTVIPGNHDAYTPLVRDPGFWRWAPYMSANEAGARFMGDASAANFPFLRLFGEIALIGLSTAVPTFPGLATGRLGHAQLQALDAMLAQLGEAGYCRVVLIHHPPLPGMTQWARALSDAPALRDVLVAQGAELVIYGHNHRFRVMTLPARTGTIPIVGAPSASLATQSPEKMARYNLLGIARTASGRWRIVLRSRTLDAGGKITEHDHGALG